MEIVCRQIGEYFVESNAFLRPDFSLATLSVETGIPQKMLSRSINVILNKSFSEMLNEMTIYTEVKSVSKIKGYWIDRTKLDAARLKEFNIGNAM